MSGLNTLIRLPAADSTNLFSTALARTMPP